MRHKLLLSYDGSLLFGWQKTPEGPSVEGLLQSAAEQILREKITLQAASRTDRGVHALGQVVSFDTESPLPCYKLFQRGVNACLPDSVRVLKAEAASSTFHPTIDVLSKEYNYFVSPGPIQLPHHRHTSWHVPYKLKLLQMREAATYFLGEHDFAGFANAKNNEIYRSTVRRLDRLDIEELENGLLKFRFIGNHFLYKMVRNLVGTLVYIGRGRLPLEAAKTILIEKNRQLAGMTAPSNGLWLHSICYD